MTSPEKILLDSYDYNLISNQRDQYISYTTLTRIIHDDTQRHIIHFKELGLPLAA